MAKIYKCVVNNYKIKLFCNKRDAEDDAVILSNLKNYFKSSSL